MTNKLVFENLKHRPVRTLIGIVVIGIQVTLILTLVGLREGTLSDQAARASGVGADIIVRPPSSSVITMSASMPARIDEKIDEQPGVKLSTGVLQQGTDLFNYVTGVDLAQFDKLSGGFHLSRAARSRARTMSWSTSFTPSKISCMSETQFVCSTGPGISPVSISPEC